MYTKITATRNNLLHGGCWLPDPKGFTKIVNFLTLCISFSATELFTDLEGAFQSKIDAAYFETSKYLLDVLNKNYQLLEHLQAMRRYLLLGQGDFIRHLMDLLK